MANIDSCDKIITSYFAAVTKEDFTYKDKTIKAMPLIVSPFLLRGTTCPENCGGCCFRFSLDYLPKDALLDNLEPRTIRFNGNNVVIYSDMQKEGTTNRCKHLNLENGRCLIHGKHPFSCDFELIRVIGRRGENNWIGTRLFGRGWAMPRIDGERGALCETIPVNEETRANSIRKMKLLQEWTDYFGLGETWIPEILEWAKGHSTRQLLLNPHKTKRGEIF